jgi:hypothetical protein
MGLATSRNDGRYVATPSGLARHDTEILKHQFAADAV